MGTLLGRLMDEEEAVKAEMIDLRIKSEHACLGRSYRRNLPAVRVLEAYGQSLQRVVKRVESDFSVSPAEK